MDWPTTSGRKGTPRTAAPRCVLAGRLEPPLSSPLPQAGSTSRAVMAMKTRNLCMDMACPPSQHDRSAGSLDEGPIPTPWGFEVWFRSPGGWGHAGAESPLTFAFCSYTLPGRREGAREEQLPCPPVPWSPRRTPGRPASPLPPPAPPAVRPGHGPGDACARPRATSSSSTSTPSTSPWSACATRRSSDDP